MSGTYKDVTLKGRSLMIGVPAYDSKIDIDSALNLLQLAGLAGKYQFQLQIAHVSGCSILPKARNTLIARFMQSDCTDFLFLDTDVIFKPEDIIRLMGVSTNKDIVAGVYPKRNKETQMAVDLVYSTTASPMVEPEFNLYEAQHAATGFMLIRRHVIEKMMAAYPDLMYAEKDENLVCYSLFDFQLKNQAYYGEDYIFCQRARDIGLTVHIDPLLKLGHKMVIKAERELVMDLYDQQIARNIDYLQRVKSVNN